MFTTRFDHIWASSDRHSTRAGENLRTGTSVVAPVRLRTPSSSPTFSVESFNIFVYTKVEHRLVSKFIGDGGWCLKTIFSGLYYRVSVRITKRFGRLKTPPLSCVLLCSFTLLKVCVVSIIDEVVKPTKSFLCWIIMFFLFWFHSLNLRHTR